MGWEPEIQNVDMVHLDVHVIVTHIAHSRHACKHTNKEFYVFIVSHSCRPLGGIRIRCMQQPRRSVTTANIRVIKVCTVVDI